jgi:hypothetical protein
LALPADIAPLSCSRIRFNATAPDREPHDDERYFR